MQLNVAGQHGIVISTGHAATHIIPVVNGRMDSAHTKRYVIIARDKDPEADAGVFTE